MHGSKDARTPYCVPTSRIISVRNSSTPPTPPQNASGHHAELHPLGLEVLERRAETPGCDAALSKKASAHGADELTRLAALSGVGADPSTQSYPWPCAAFSSTALACSQQLSGAKRERDHANQIEPAWPAGPNRKAVCAQFRYRERKAGLQPASYNRLAGLQIEGSTLRRAA